MLWFGYFKFEGKSCYTVFLVKEVQVTQFCKLAERNDEQSTRGLGLPTFPLLHLLHGKCLPVVLRNQIKKF